MTLSISKKYYQEMGGFGTSLQPAFNAGKNKLTVVFNNHQCSDSRSLNGLIKRVNSLEKPYFYSINSFLHLIDKIDKINTLAKQAGLSETIDKQSFDDHLSPLVQELKERLAAVHVSNFLWPEAIIKPFFAQLGSDKPSPGISLSIHFSLGEMVRPHSHIYNWDFRKFAVVTPLKSILRQTVSIDPYDTVVYGNWEIDMSSKVLVPEGTVIPAAYIQKGLKVLFYNPKNITLRKKIEATIHEHDLLSLRLLSQVSNSAKPAYLDERRQININTQTFFSSLLSLNKELSLGGDVLTRNGRDGYIFGILRHYSFKLQSPGNTNSMQKKVLNDYLDYALKKIRKKLNEEDIAQLEALLNQPDLPKTPFPKHRVQFPIISMLKHLSYEEMLVFKKQNQELFSDITDYIDEATWAVDRWLLIGEKLGKAEELEEIYKRNINMFLKKDGGTLTNSNIIQVLLESLQIEMPGYQLALYILNLQETKLLNRRIINQVYFETMNGLFYLVPKPHCIVADSYTATTIEEILPLYYNGSHKMDLTPYLEVLQKLHKYSQGNEKNSFDKEETEKLEIFSKINIIPIETDINLIRNSFVKLSHILKYIPKELELYHTPLSALSTLPFSILLEWKQLYGAECLWSGFGLQDEYKRNYPNDDDFWQSSDAFVTVYRRLKAP